MTPKINKQKFAQTVLDKLVEKNMLAVIRPESFPIDSFYRILWFDARANNNISLRLSDFRYTTLKSLEYSNRKFDFKSEHYTAFTILGLANNIRGPYHLNTHGGNGFITLFGEQEITLASLYEDFIAFLNAYRHTEENDD